MPIFQRPPLETLAPAKDRWTPLYLEHGRIEVDDSSIQWIAATGLVSTGRKPCRESVRGIQKRGEAVLRRQAAHDSTGSGR